MAEIARFFAELAPTSGSMTPRVAAVLFACAFLLAAMSIRRMAFEAQKQNGPTVAGRLLRWPARLSFRRIQWRRPLDAMDAWADPALVLRKREAFERSTEIHQHHDITERTLQTLSAADSGALVRHLVFYRQLAELADQQLQHFVDELRLDIERKLWNGELMARGIPAADPDDAGEITIKPREWRRLVIDPKTERALDNSDGSERYLHLKIGNRKR